MTTSEPIQQDGPTFIPSEAVLRRVRFVRKANAGQDVLLTFVDPAPCVAVCITTEGNAAADADEGRAEGVDVLTLAGQPNDQFARLKAKSAKVGLCSNWIRRWRTRSASRIPNDSKP